VPEEDWERVITDPNPSEASPADTASRREERVKIMQALDQLSEDHRRIIMLGDLEGLSYREIAETLEIPMGTVMSRLHNARKRLRDVLGPLLMLVLALLLTLAAPAAAQAPAPRPAPVPTQAPAPGQSPIVRFGARVLMGTDAPLPSGLRAAPADGDERLVAFMPKLRQLFRYKEYASLERYRAEVAVGTLQSWRVPSDRMLELLPESVSGDTVRMRVRLMRGSLTELATNIQAARGNPAVIGGPRYGDGVLIIIVWANANPAPR
jgi:predicted DNA-binding protein (UPF0251 family)